MSGKGQRLQARTVLITGASSGLGEQIAYEAAKQGASVILTARRSDRLHIVAGRCRELSGTEAWCYQLDLGNPEQVARVLDTIIKDVGRIDVLVNNAGFGLFAEAVDTPDEVTEQMFRVNVVSLIQITRQLAAEMKNAGSGHVINIASQAGKIATPKSAVYAATKFAVRGYSNALRLELKPFGINVTCVNIGPMHTDFFNHADPGGSYLTRIERWVLDPKAVAKKVVDCMLTDRREINLPRMMEIGARLYVLFPRIGDYITSTLFNRK
ncbi:MAG: SDR family oxidoreductase [Firmicutes bacterium]|jgi:short-subunit dehydrogenase|nr:SDR family oxidoreductase [Bacillota bacterium]NLL88260.1 SDR family oxidoreductase [Bacillota bacterium]HKM17892.1 SDR family oxidoreductase [Limnochordia bacterium]